jgi:hypothetical protein
MEFGNGTSYDKDKIIINNADDRRSPLDFFIFATYKKHFLLNNAI